MYNKTCKVKGGTGGSRSLKELKLMDGLILIFLSVPLKLALAQTLIYYVILIIRM
jgi:hypothetical protein